MKRSRALHSPLKIASHYMAGFFWLKGCESIATVRRPYRSEAVTGTPHLTRLNSKADVPPGSNGTLYPIPYAGRSVTFAQTQRTLKTTYSGGGLHRPRSLDAPWT